MIAKFFGATVLWFFGAFAHASSLGELVRPVLISPQAAAIDESCLKDVKCLRKAEAAKFLLVQIYHSFNEMLYRKDGTSLKFTSPKFSASVGQAENLFRKQAIGDAEQVVSFAIQNFESINSGKELRLKIYTILFTEGSLFFVEADVTFVSASGNGRWQLESYEVIKNRRRP